MQTLVIKLGTSTLTGGTPYLSRPNMLDIIRQIVALREDGYRIVLVSSGAMAAGREMLNNPQLPNHLPAKQMLSAVGQSYLMQVYTTLFGLYDIHIGQILLTHEDLRHRTRYLNARNTITTILEHGIVPIVNENDTVAVEEIKVGDNDNLSAMIATLIDADWLFLLTDQDGLYDHDPRQNADAQLIHHISQIDDKVWRLAGDSVSGLGTGGMLTKIQAAQLAARSGTHTVIANGSTPDIVKRILQNESLGTIFAPVATQLESRKRWLLTERPCGTIQVDKGAAQVLCQDGASLLPVGIRAVEGDFQRGDVILITNQAGESLAHGLSNYRQAELTRIAGQQSTQISEILGFTYGSAAVHRDNLVLLKGKEISQHEH